MTKQVLVSGGSGLVGSRLTETLLQQGYEVAHLNRSRKSQNGIKTYIWNIDEGFIEQGALQSANIVVHLAGAGVADERWTQSRKKQILESRVQSTRLLYETLRQVDHRCQTFISASAVGIYGWDTGSQWVDEASPPGKGFLAEVTERWENEVKRLEELKMRVVLFRIGIVLSEDGGALPKIAQPVKLGAGAPLGSGEQYISWIHIDDLCRMFVNAIQDQNMEGPYNAVAPNPVTNKEFTEILAGVLDKPLLLPPVPALALKLMLGERAQIVLGGNRVSSKKIEETGFDFRFTELRPALESILK